ncbi:hypothetical protein [Thiocapsa roseopersicina]|uniref:Hpr(Ser) kinase/phosphatase n=1 Tax=Thiocapsa roseopersicina TaxID=1058 RepID=A0A1H2Y2B4_THIRO|nr:hypothetical protein [Thiocapsa roseopersicina]SDW99276.1 hypothetical protein SAMN05421783_1128 [Thiocapsa roseopersicina]
MKQSRFSVVERVVAVVWGADSLSPVMTAAFGGFKPCASRQPAALAYRIISESGNACFSLVRNGSEIGRGLDASKLLFALQQDIVVGIQRLRPDLVFVHAAVVQRDGRAFLLAAPSGSGKSTLCWALLHYGFRLMSDELAPVEPETLRIKPFPLAVTLKMRPPQSFPLPPSTLETHRSHYIPIDAMPCAPATEPAPIGAILFVDYASNHSAPALCKLSAAEAAYRLYPNVLNALAHQSMCLDDVIRMTCSVPCWYLASAALEGTAKEVAGLLCAL